MTDPGSSARSLRRDVRTSVLLSVLLVLVLTVYAVYLAQFAGEFYLAVRGAWLLAADAALLTAGTVAALAVSVRSRRAGRRLGRWHRPSSRPVRAALAVLWAGALAAAAYGVYVVGRTLALGAMGSVPTAAIAVLALPFAGYAVVLLAWALTSFVRSRSERPRLPRGSLLVGAPVVAVFAAFGVLHVTGHPTWTPGVDHEELFAPGDLPGRAFRIPALTVAGDTVIAFAESRQEAMSDLLDIDIVERRSTDGGRTWSPTQVVVSDGSHTVHSPAPVYDPATSTTWLPYCVDYRRLWVVSSTDAGLTWSAPRDLSAELGVAAGTWCHNGPGNGIVLTSGRLLIPTTIGDPRSLSSDDQGATWRLGRPMVSGGEEPQVVQRVDGQVCATLRSPRGTGRTATCSADGGQTWAPAHADPHLLSAGTQASVMRLSGVGDGLRSRILFSGPGVPYRADMTLRLSEDDGATWPVSRTLWDGAAGYSDIAVLPDHTILVAFEAGRDDLRESVSLARVDLAWLTRGAETAP